MSVLGISWQHPLRLWLLAALPLLAFGFYRAWRCRRRDLRRFAQEELLTELAPAVWSRRIVARDFCRLGVLVALVLALAGPRYGFKWEKVERQGIDLLVAIDTSKSMLARDVKPNRLERAKLAVLDLVKMLKGDRIGLIAFAGTAFLQCPLTLDYGAFVETLQAVDVGMIPRGGTSLARAIDAAVEAFHGRQGRNAALVIITDGEDHEGNAEAAATKAAALGIKIFLVGIGTEEGELIPLREEGQEGRFLKDREGRVVKTRLNSAALEKIAEATGGLYTHGQGSSLGLEEIFHDQIAKMEKSDVQASIAQRHEQRFQLALVISLLFLAGEAMLAEMVKVPSLVKPVRSVLRAERQRKVRR